MKKTGLILFALIAVLVGVVACKKDEPDDAKPGFDRVAMLTEYRDKFILPAYQDALVKSTALSDAAASFVAAPSAAGLSALQSAWINGIVAWQQACMYNFGPAGESGILKSLQEELATFPVNENKLNTILNTGTWNTNDFNRDARGFFAAEFLIFDPTADAQAIVERFNAQTRKDFLLALVNDIRTRIANVQSAWSSYSSEFVSNSGTDAGSSVSLMYNEFVKSYEALKNFKFGLPLGLRPGQTAVAPELLEARYSRISFRLAKVHFNHLVNFYRGLDEAKSYKGYLKTVTGGEALVTETETQLTVLSNLFNALDENLDMSERIVNNPQALIDLHTELQKNTKNFKSDMSSLLGIAITFSSGDGD